MTTSHALLDVTGHFVSDQWNNVTFAAHMWHMCLLHLSHFSLIEIWTWWSLHADQQASIIIHKDSCTHLMKSDHPLLAVDRVQKGQAFSTIYLLQLTGPGYSSFLLEKGKLEVYECCHQHHHLCLVPILKRVTKCYLWSIVKGENSTLDCQYFFMPRHQRPHSQHLLILKRTSFSFDKQRFVLTQCRFCYG